MYSCRMQKKMTVYVFLRLLYVGEWHMNTLMIPIDQVKVGIRAEASQLKEIYNKYMILLYDDSDDKRGTLVFYGETQDDEYTKWFEQDNPITPIYNSKDERTDMIVYDE